MSRNGEGVLLRMGKGWSYELGRGGARNGEGKANNGIGN